MPSWSIRRRRRRAASGPMPGPLRRDVEPDQRGSRRPAAPARAAQRRGIAAASSLIARLSVTSVHLGSRPLFDVVPAFDERHGANRTLRPVAKVETASEPREERSPRRAAGDAPHPPLRGEGRGALPRRRAARLPPRRDRPGGVRGRRLPRARGRRRHRLDAPRARPHAREGDASERADGRAVRQAGGLLARLRRLDAPLRHRARQHGRERRHRRRAAAHHRCCARVPDARRASRRARVLRRRGDEHRHVPRGAQPRAALEGAGRVRARGQQVGRVDAGVAALPDPRSLRSARRRSA